MENENIDKEKLLKDVQEHLRQNRGSISPVTDEERRKKGEEGLKWLMKIASAYRGDGAYDELRAFSRESEAQRNKLVEFCYEKISDGSFAVNMSGPFDADFDADYSEGYIYKGLPADGDKRHISIRDADRYLKGAIEYVGQHMKDPKLCDVIVEIMDKHDIKPSKVYTDAQVTRQAFSKIIAANSKVTPKKTTLWCIILGLDCDKDEADRILRSGGYASSSEQDHVLEYFIECNLHDIATANYILDGMGLPLLTPETPEKDGRSAK